MTDRLIVNCRISKIMNKDYTRLKWRNSLVDIKEYRCGLNVPRRRVKDTSCILYWKDLCSWHTQDRRLELQVVLTEASSLGGGIRVRRTGINALGLEWREEGRAAAG